MSKAKVVAKVLGKGAGKSSASKAAKRKRPSKATQKGVRFSKENYSVQEGAGLAVAVAYVQHVKWMQVRW